LCDHKKIDPSRVFVSYLAADENVFYPAKDSSRKSDVFQRYNIPDSPYMLGLSTLEPRKNIAHTIRSFLDFIEQEKVRDLKLVLVGAKGWSYQEIFDALGGKPSLADKVVFTGYVDDEDLAIIYSNALAFIYMSLYEGFGLPPLEAMNCGIPVITSNTSSLPEVVGDAGIMLMPDDRDQLSQCLLQVYSNDNLREEMSRKSLERSRLFTWKRSCETLIDAYKVAKRS
jgi:glycosyltransferase involved in cell wall biosynthesis